MARKGTIKPRNIEPDAVYNSYTVAKLINAVLRDGKKNVAQTQVYKCLELLAKEFPKEDVIIVLEQALDNIKPKIEVRPRRIGGAVYQVPTPVKAARQQSLAIRWLILSSRGKANKQFHTFAEKLLDELKLALKNEGSSVGKRLEVERMAEANKAFAHFRV